MRSRLLRAALIGAVAVGLTVPAVPAQAINGSFTSFSAPLVASVDYATGFTCGIGPVGTRVETTRAFIVDFCHGITYKFPPAGGDISDAGVSSLGNGFDGGLTKLGSTYYGVIQLDGVYTFDPDTLVRGPQLCSPPSGSFRDVLADPIHGDLWISSNTGMYRVHPADSTPTPHLIASGDFDGIGISGDGSIIYAASLDQTVRGFNSGTNAEVLNVSIPGGHGVDGIAVHGNDIFMNSNDGTIERVDGVTHDVTVVASGGTRGDFVTVGADGSLYATQSDRVVKLVPNIFDPAPTASPSLSKSDSSSSGTLPRTGFPAGLVAGVAAAVVVLGAVLLLAGRRRRDGASG